MGLRPCTLDNRDGAGEGAVCIWEVITRIGL